MTTTSLEFHCILRRQAWTQQGTFGELVFDPAYQWFTAEQADRGNKPFVSCIPTGIYELRRAIYYGSGRRKPYGVWEIYPVPGRTLIYTHIANFPEELAGCVALGLHRTGKVGAWGVSHSAAAIKEWMRATAGFERGTIEVVNAPWREEAYAA